MLSPTPLSLLCALLLCLPLAIVFTITTPTTTTTINTHNHETPITIYEPTSKIYQNSIIKPIISPSPSPSPPRPSLLPSPRPSLSHETPITIHEPTSKIYQNPIIKPIISTSPPRPSQPTTPRPRRRSLSPSLPPPPPPDDDDDDDDESLLRVASRVNKKPKSPKKVAFMFLTTTPLPFEPLWELFFNQTTKKYKNLFNIYIHADPTHRYNPPFKGVFAHRVIPSKPSKRFTPTLTAAARRTLAHALLDDPSNSMFAFFSPSCIPIHSFRFTYETLIHSNKSFIEILQNEAGTYDRWVARGPDAMLPEVKLEDFRIGSQFWVLTRKHAWIVVRDRKVWRKFNQPCVRWDTCYPEENYFPTLIHMRDPRGSVPATLTHVDWRGRYDGHPRMYTAAEVGPELISALRKGRPRYGSDGANGSDVSVRKQNDPFLFARKFHPNSIQVLLSIAKDVILKD